MRPFLLALIPLAAPSLCSQDLWTEARVLEEFARSPRRVALDEGIAAVAAEGRGRALLANPSVSYSREGAGFTEFLQVEQTLPFSGRRKLLEQSGQSRVTAAEAARDAQWWEQRIALRMAFFDLLAAQERVAALAATLVQLRELTEILSTRERLGEGSRYDRLRGEREISEIDADRGAAEAAQAVALARVRAFVPGAGLASGTLDTPAFAATPEEIATRALATRAELRTVDRTLATLAIEQQAADRLRRPDPTINAGMKRANTGFANDTAYVAGISVPIPSFNRGQFEVARLSAEQRSLAAVRLAIEQRVRAEISGALEALATRRRALAEYRSTQLAGGAELVRIARIAYQEGEIGILELLDAVRVERLAQLRSIDLAAAVKNAQLELDRAAGLEVQP
ncbi:MAG: TolC family protein [Bryobacteraceae bacterium]|nr:TolC family protein [Bryobacteraceae bacterium]